MIEEVCNEITLESGLPAKKKQTWSLYVYCDQACIPEVSISEMLHISIGVPIWF